MAATQSGPGMDKAELRQHVLLARRAPIHLAFALGLDGKPVLMMDKRKPPRLLERELRAANPDARNARFGTLSIDGEKPALAHVSVNKPASGMARKLTVAFKGTGVREVELVLEDGTSVETAKAEDDAALDAQDTAAEVAAPLPAPAEVAAAAVQRYRKSREVWRRTRAKVDAEIEALRKTVLALDVGESFGEDLEDKFDTVIDPVLSTLDDSLGTLLYEAEEASDQETVDRLLMQARSTIGLYQQFVASNETIRALDGNPFAPMAIAKTLDASLTALAAALR